MLSMIKLIKIFFKIQKEKKNFALLYGGKKNGKKKRIKI